MSKTCTKCKEVKTVDCFSKQSTGKDGLHPECKVCKKERNRIYNKANPEKLKIRSRKWRAVYPEKEKASQDKYRLANREKEKERQRKYRADNTEKKKAANSKWSKANPENNRHRTSIRRARKLANGVYEISSNELKKLYESPCAYCGSQESIQADHVVPIARGGTHSIGNLVAACARCNQSKGSKFLTEWKRSLAWVS
jgi:5-methylcytosine-specific restriction endonuclease McrA